MDFEVLKRLVAALEARQVKYAIFGAVAMNLHGLARATEDVDLFVAPDAANVERLRQALRDVFEDPDVDQITAADLQGEYPAIRYAPPNETFYLDIVARLGEAFDFANLDIVRVPFHGLTASVVTPATLYRMKRDTVRPKDRADAEMIRRTFRDRFRVMPVYRFRSIDEMSDPSRREPGDPALYRAIASLWDASRRLAPRRYPHGVYRFRSVDDANRHREAWEAANAARIAREREAGDPLT